MDIKPLETTYNGYRFRSRLEARWAVFFDALGVKYEYEPEGYKLPDGSCYLPDFLIHDVEGIHGCRWRTDIFVEVKGDPDQESANKVAQFSRFYNPYYRLDPEDTTKPVWVVGNIPDPYNYVSDMSKQRYDYCTHYSNLLNQCALCINDFGPLDSDRCFEFSIDYTDHLIFHGADSNYGFGSWSDKIRDAFIEARQARFEHGEKPKTAKNNIIRCPLHEHVDTCEGCPHEHDTTCDYGVEIGWNGDSVVGLYPDYQL